MQDRHGAPIEYPIGVFPLFVRAWAPRAVFARPEFPSEAMSYQVPTPSAVRGFLSSIYWKPQFQWRVREIRVLNPIRWFSETRNEVTRKATKTLRPIIADECRIQRHTLGLRDVAYVFVAEAIPVPYDVEGIAKHAEIFLNRVRKGQCYTQPYLGRRECSAFFAEATGAHPPIAETRDLGRMLFDLNFRKGGMTYLKDRNETDASSVWFDARLDHGVVHVPDHLYRWAGGSRGPGRMQPDMPPADYAA